MSVLYLHFESAERASRAQKLEKSGAHIIVTEPRWPGFFELAKKEKPYAIAVDFSYAPSHALETADYLAKARETREASFYVLHVPEDRVELVRKRLPHASLVTEEELSRALEVKEKEARARALEKKEAAALARKNARAKKAAGQPGAPKKPKPAAPGRPKRPAPSRLVAKKTKAKSAAKKKAIPKKSQSPQRRQKKKKKS